MRQPPEHNIIVEKLPDGSYRAILPSRGGGLVMNGETKYEALGRLVACYAEEMGMTVTERPC